jgi:hypothetical protein
VVGRRSPPRRSITLEAVEPPGERILFLNAARPRKVVRRPEEVVEVDAVRRDEDHQTKHEQREGEEHRRVGEGVERFHWTGLLPVLPLNCLMQETG